MENVAKKKRKRLLVVGVGVDPRVVGLLLLLLLTVPRGKKKTTTARGNDKGKNIVVGIVVVLAETMEGGALEGVVPLL